MNQAPFTVSVIIPVLNAIRTLPMCLAALEALDPKPLEILLVDNGSTDGSLLLLRDFSRRHPTWVRVFEEGRRGASITRNTGARHATGEVLAFTDSDCAPAPHWLKELLTPFVDPMVGAVAGRIDAGTPASTLQWFSALYTLQSPGKAARYHRWTPTEGGFPTANFGIRRDLMQQLHGFDESVAIYGEDFDLCARLYEQGAVIVFQPDSRVAHHHRTGLRAVLRQAFGFGRSHAYLLRKHTVTGCWVEWPRRAIIWIPFPIRSWVNLISADKKLLWLLLLGALWHPLWWLVPCYGAWLAWDARRRAERRGMPASVGAALTLAGMHVLKAGAMTLGRWSGSATYGVICF